MHDQQECISLYQNDSLLQQAHHAQHDEELWRGHPVCSSENPNQEQRSVLDIFISVNAVFGVLFGLDFFLQKVWEAALSKKCNIDIYWRGNKLVCICSGAFPLPRASFWWLRCLFAAWKSCKESELQCFPARRVVSKGMSSTWRAVAHLEVCSVP